MTVHKTTAPTPRAWLVWPKGWPIDETGQHMVIAPTREKAMAHSLRAAREAGYKLRLPDMRAVRYPAGDPR
jgi:hypothetical protein